MSRRNRRLQRVAVTLPASQATVDNPPAGSYPSTPPAGGFGRTGYESAQWSANAGYIYWPSIDPDHEITPYSRTETARKIHYFCANHGLPRRILWGLTNLVVGPGLRPQSLTTDTAWNRVAEASYHNRGSSPITYDAGGVLTDTRAQRTLVNTAFKDGDAAAILTKSATGGAMRAFYSGLQIGNSSTTALPQDLWTDGVRLGSCRRPIAYRFPGENGSIVDVPSEDMIFLCRYESLGQRRGTSILSHAARKMTHITEIDAAVTQGIKAANQIGYYLAADAQAPPVSGMKAALKMAPGQQKTVTTPDGKKVTLKVVMGNGNEIAELPPGYDIKTLLDSRPHPNSREFVDNIIRDISWGAGVSSDLLWNIYKLGGANVRYVMADAQVFVTVEQQWLVDYYLSRDWVFHVACEMKAGRLRQCEDPEWWKHGWIPPARMTVDFGRDGAIYQRWVQAGMLTMNRWYQLNGQDAREETLQHLDFCAWRKKEMNSRGLTLAECYPAQPGAAPLATEEPAKDDKETKDDPNPEE